LLVKRLVGKYYNFKQLYIIFESFLFEKDFNFGGVDYVFIMPIFLDVYIKNILK
jgi:hypothetical protein